MNKAVIYIYLLAALVFCSGTHALEVGQKAPNWMLETHQGEPVLLNNLTDQNKAVVMLFWATWCQSSDLLLDTLESLSQLSNKSNNPAVDIYILNMWEELDAQEHLNQKGINLPLLTKAETVAQRYGVSTVPALVLVKPDRTIGLIKSREPIETQLESLKEALSGYLN